MIFGHLIPGILIGVFAGLLIREAILIYVHGWCYEEKLRIYNKERLHK